MMIMLRFQRRKMERALQPGLLRRLLHRGRARLKVMWASNRESQTLNREIVDRQATELPVLVRENRQGQQQQATIRQMPVSKYAQQNQQRNKNRQNKNRKKGRSIS